MTFTILNGIYLHEFTPLFFENNHERSLNTFTHGERQNNEQRYHASSKVGSASRRLSCPPSILRGSSPRLSVELRSCSVDSESDVSIKTKLVRDEKKDLRNKCSFYQCQNRSRRKQRQVRSEAVCEERRLETLKLEPKSRSYESTGRRGKSGR